MKREKLYKIGEVMQYTNLSRQTLHNYTVAGLIHEARRTISGHRFMTKRPLIVLSKSRYCSPRIIR